MDFKLYPLLDIKFLYPKMDITSTLLKISANGYFCRDYIVALKLILRKKKSMPESTLSYIRFWI